MKLAEYLCEWNRVLSITSPGPDAAMAEALEMPLERLRLYRKLVHAHYQRAVEKMYPRLQRLAPQALTNELLQRYYQAFPPSAWELNHLAQHFAEFLKAQTDVPAVWAEIAQYEWAEFITYLHPEEEAKVEAEMQPGDLALNPTLTLLQCTHRVHDWAQAMDSQPSAGPTPPPPVGPQNILFGRKRNPYGTSIVEPALPGLVVLQCLSAGPVPWGTARSQAAEILSLDANSIDEEIETLIEWQVILKKDRTPQ